MASFKSLQMAAELSANPNIEIKKSFLGLSTSVVYKPTGSRMDIIRNDYSLDDGEKIKRLFSSKREQLATIANQLTDIKPAPMGPVRVEACISQDHQFAALQLFTYADFQYTAWSEVQYYEGVEAEVVSMVF